ncbi:MAG: hypothetical protein OHK0019_33660 [Saprospiraceae bacterium]
MNRIYLIAILFLSHITLKAQDSIPPFITCPPNDTVTLPPGGDCTFQYFYAIASSDNEPGDTLVQLAGLESGEDFPLGNTVNIFQAIDAAGNTASCSFTLTVQNYAGPLTCKNDILISLDTTTCTWVPGAADLLIDNAGCTNGYYLLEADKTPPYGNGPWVAAEFGPDDIGKTFAFRVSDTTFGYHCIGSVSINDLLPPALTCDSFDILCAVGNVSPYFLRDSLGIAAAVPIAMDACGPLKTFQHQDLSVSNSCASNYVGYINRKWTAQDNFGNSSTCIQQIRLVRPHISDLKYPPDVTVDCDADISIGKTGQPYLEFAGRKFTNLCQLGAVANDTLVQTTSCNSQILRTWFVIDWCTGEALEKIQTIDIVDQTEPEFLNCPDSTLTIGDTSATNDTLLWNAPHWLTPQTGMENLCEGPTDLQATAFDACSGTIANVRYLLFLDLDNDGTQETVVDSDNPPAAGTVNFGNAGNPNYAGGESRSFDERPVDSTLKYRFALQTLATGDTSSFRVVWNSDSLPGVFTTPQLPPGTHKIRWIAQDSCDNESICEYNFIVKDNKAPTVICESGLFVDLLPTCLATVHAIDFLDEAIDNCSPSSSLIFSMRRAGNGTGFPVDTAGNPITNFTFTANYLGSQSIELWVQDLAGNAGFCIAFIDVQDPGGACDPTGFSVAGDIKTETNDGVENVNVHLQSGIISLFDLTDAQGNFIFQHAVPFGATDTVTPSLNSDPLNGVSTFDLVLISKHILGLEALGSPYKMIAADANKSNSITTFDIVEFRKLILGIYNTLPNNKSWRFVPKEYVFPNPANPFQPPFPESIIRNNIFADQLDDDFIGIKVGDVNNTVIANDFQSTDDRTHKTLFFNVKNRAVQAGEEVIVQFTAAEQVQGWQFTLNTDDLKTLAILPGAGMSEANFAVFDDAITTSVENEATTFSVKFLALKTGRLDEMLSISSRITRAEAYEPNGKMTGVALRFDDGATAQPGFELFQNQPNPFSDHTNIGFYLPENADATLTIFDETGRVLFTQSGHYARGYHVVFIEKTSLGATGVLYYKLETPTHNAVRKMVLVK